VRTTFRILIGLLFIFIISCATGYHARNILGGYWESWHDDDYIMVYYEGNRFTDIQKARDYCLLRCAIITLQKGGTHFQIIVEDTIKQIIRDTPESKGIPWIARKVRILYRLEREIPNTYDAVDIVSIMRRKYPKLRIRTLHSALRR
jgi:hypothetical protein